MNKILKKDDTLLEVIIGTGDAQGYELMEEKTADSTVEKHVPFIEEIEGGYRVKVGETTEHPMIENHYIQFIEIVAGDRVYKKYLKPGDKPQAEFLMEKADKVYAREHCNIHGLWKGEK